jgi:hypothetical protein
MKESYLQDNKQIPARWGVEEEKNGSQKQARKDLFVRFSSCSMFSM